MSRMIDAEKIRITADTKIDVDGDALVSLADVRKAIALTPTEDLQEVKHGHWWDCGSLSCRCSVCGCKNNRESNYCPICGARMDGEKK